MGRSNWGWTLSINTRLIMNFEEPAQKCLKSHQVTPVPDTYERVISFSTRREDRGRKRCAIEVSTGTAWKASKEDAVHGGENNRTGSIKFNTSTYHVLQILGALYNLDGACSTLSSSTTIINLALQRIDVNLVLHKLLA